LRLGDNAEDVRSRRQAVRPKLYIVCGIRGAVQHFVRMQSSEIIVAINKDPVLIYSFDNRRSQAVSYPQETA
jgi:hypothetical protein